jgi:hypothetical protein
VKRRLVRLAVLGAVVAAVIPISAASASSAPYCGITWGSTAKSVYGAATTTFLTNVRAGRHACYDRLVIDGAQWAKVAYVSRVVEDPSGRPVPLRGGAFLRVVTSRSDDTRQLTYDPANPRELVNLTGYRTLRQAALAGNFEGQTTIGLGVRARLPFRVFVLETPGTAPRVVIDVAHLW